MLIKEKVQLWRDRFFGRQEVFGYKKSFFSVKDGKPVSQYLPMYREKYQTKESRKGKTFNSPSELYIPLGDNHIENHIKGIMELLIYVLQTDGNILFLGLDFDLKHTFEDVMATKRMLESHGVRCAVARSTKKGHHIYTFFDKPIEAKYVTSYVNHVYEELGFMDQLRNEGRALPETFPKTIDLRDVTSTGYGIKPPMQGKGQENDQNCWVDEHDKPIGGSGKSPEQWEFFEQIPKNSVEGFKQFLVDSKIEVMDIRMSEKRGAVKQREYKRLTPYEPPKDGDLNLILSGCPAMKRLWDGASKDMSHEARVALLSWAMQTQNGVQMLREKWNFSDQAEEQIQYAIETYQQPWTCRALQEHNICVKGRDPKFASGKIKDSQGVELTDFCFKKVPPRETIDGKVVKNPKDLPEEDWSDPSPVRLRIPFKKIGVKNLKEQIDDLKEDDAELGDKIADIYQQIVELRDAKQKSEVIKHLKSKKLAKVAELKDFEKEAKEIRKLEKARELDRGDGIQVVNGTRYTTLDSGGYATLDLDKEGNTVVAEISNFEIELERDIRMHSILNGNVRELEGYILCQTVKYPFNIPTAEWNSNTKLASSIAQSAGSSAAFRMINLDRIREAATQFGTKSLELENSFEDYGFDDDIDPTVFRSTNYNVTSDGVIMDGDHVDLKRQEFAKHLGLDDITKEEFQQAIRIIKNDLLELQDSFVTYTTIAHSLQAAIHGPFIPLKDAPVLWIQGLTGSGKSTIAKFAQAFHGFFPRLLNVNSTLRGIEFNAMLFKDALLVIDDYKEGFHRDGTIKLIQSFYDRSSRAKQRKDGSSAVGTACRGLVMFTAEDRPTAEASALSRCLYLESPHIVSDSKENDERFKRILGVERLFPGVLARFIHYMMQNYANTEELADKFWDYTGALKDEIRNRQNSHRIAQNLAANYMTWELFLDFVEASGMLTKEEKSEYLEQHWRNVIQLRDALVEVCGFEQASSVYLEAVKDLISSGKYSIEGIGDTDIKFTTVIGFAGPPGSGKVYLFPNPSVRAAKEMLRGVGSGISHSVSAIGKQLLQEGYITKSGKDRSQIKKSYKGTKKWVWEVDCIKSGIGASVKLLDNADAKNLVENAPDDVDMSSF